MVSPLQSVREEAYPGAEHEHRRGGRQRRQLRRRRQPPAHNLLEPRRLELLAGGGADLGDVREDEGLDVAVEEGGAEARGQPDDEVAPAPKAAKPAMVDHAVPVWGSS